MKRLTVQELIEPPIEYVVPDGTQLPDEIRYILRLYTGVSVTNTKTGQTGTRYIIPQHLMREWLAKYAEERKKK